MRRSNDEGDARTPPSLSLSWFYRFLNLWPPSLLLPTFYGLPEAYQKRSLFLRTLSEVPLGKTRREPLLLRVSLLCFPLCYREFIEYAISFLAVGFDAITLAYVLCDRNDAIVEMTGVRSGLLAKVPESYLRSVYMWPKCSTVGNFYEAFRRLRKPPSKPLAKDLQLHERSCLHNHS